MDKEKAKKQVNSLYDDTDSINNPENYKIRFMFEYNGLHIRILKLERLLKRWDDNELDFEPDSPRYILEKQLEYMRGYLHILEKRAEYENIDLTSF